MMGIKSLFPSFCTNIFDFRDKVRSFLVQNNEFFLEKSAKLANLFTLNPNVSRILSTTLNEGIARH